MAAAAHSVQPPPGTEGWHDEVLRWFEANRRSLPWRDSRDPYRVLVAEVLAQQTQAARAAAAYPRFLARFPDAAALAAAAPAEVLVAWQGLGYNRRALALHRAAREVTLNGWPHTLPGLLALPGVGPYTARAVGCFALGWEVAPVDTNVARVLARAVRGADPAELRGAERQRLADAMLPAGRAWWWSSALMDVGARHCRPVPRCDGCPFMVGCKWRALGALAPPARARRQPPFAASDRRWRGAVVRALAARHAGVGDGGMGVGGRGMDVGGGGMRAAELAAASGAGAASVDRDAGWFEGLLGRLVAEGLVACTDGRYHLPDAPADAGRPEAGDDRPAGDTFSRRRRIDRKSSLP